MDGANAYDDVTELSEEVVEQAQKDVAVVVSALLQLAEHFGLELDEYRSEISIAYLAGYLRECGDCGSPTQVVEAVGEFYEELVKSKVERYYFRQRVNGSLN